MEKTFTLSPEEKEYRDRFGLTRMPGGQYVVIDVNEYLSSKGHPPAAIIEYSNDRESLEEKAGRMALLELEASEWRPPDPEIVRNCPLRTKTGLVSRPIEKTGRGPLNWRYADELLVCPECGVRLVPVFSKYFEHP